MVKRIPFIAVLLMSAFVSKAQYDFPGNEYSALSFHEFYPSKKNISLFADYYSGSTAITNKFFNYYYLGKFIDTELKNDVSKRLDDNDNLIGAGFNASL